MKKTNIIVQKYIRNTIGQFIDIIHYFEKQNLEKIILEYLGIYENIINQRLESNYLNLTGWNQKILWYELYSLNTSL